MLTAASWTQVEIEGLWWPGTVKETWKHSLRHVQAVEWVLKRAAPYRTAIQAGGNIGVWPRRIAERFARVITCEPDPISHDCLIRNVPAHVEVHQVALGATRGTCGIGHRGLGSHQVIAGTDVPVVPIDEWAVADVDLIQLDVEGYEWQALQGARETIRRWQPWIQVELRTQERRYDWTHEQLRAWLTAEGYLEVSYQQGANVVFQSRRR